MLFVEAVTGQSVDGAYSMTFVFIAVLAYLARGIGMGLAAIGYFGVTRPRCRMCGRR